MPLARSILRRNVIFIFIFILLVLQIGVTHSESFSILVAGYFTTSQGEPMPCYWKNGCLVKLSIGNNTAGKANCIGRMDGRIYAAGFFKDHSGVEKPCYWENDVFVPLPLVVPSKNGQVRSIAFYNQEPYLGGYCFNEAVATDRCYWRGTELNHWPLTPLETESSAYSVAVDHGDIFVCGYYVPPGDSGAIAFYTPCYWKNKTLYKLPISSDISQNAWATSMTISENALFFAGYLNPLSNAPTPCYWRDNRNIDLAVLDPKKGGWTSSIAVSNANLFIAGYCKDRSGVTKPCVWLNESIRVLPTINPQRDGYAKSICATGTETYVAGSCRTKAGILTPCLWKNGRLTLLPVPDDRYDTAANSVFVSD